MLNRRGLITGLVSFVAAPAIVRASSLMPLRGVPLSSYIDLSELELGFVITRKAIEEHVLSSMFEPEVFQRISFVRDVNLDCYEITGPSQAVWDAWHQIYGRAKMIRLSALPNCRNGDEPCREV